VGRIWGSFACPTLRDPGNADLNERCQVENGFFVLENCF